MTLTDYLREESMVLNDMCKITGIKHDTMSKYKYGLRIPNLTNMKLIAMATKYKVNANDFYGTNNT